GSVTNDSLPPGRALFVGGAVRRGAAPRSSTRRRPRPGRLGRSGPPAGAGRWSLVAPLMTPLASPTEVTHARAIQLLERYGVLTREAALGEGVEGGFAGVYPVLKALEERGAVRRGYFVAGLGAAQFAMPGAVDRLRSSRASSDDDSGSVFVLAATDPANPFGAAIAWPSPVGAGRPARVAGAHVVVRDGELLAFLERGGHSLVTFPAAAAQVGWAGALRGLVERRRYRSLEIRRVDGVPAREASAVAAELVAAGFQDGYKGLVLRPPR
ncbi:MAG: Lhr family helicase, partial [Acidimicrobiales bacterium]